MRRYCRILLLCICSALLLPRHAAALDLEGSPASENIEDRTNTDPRLTYHKALTNFSSAISQITYVRSRLEAYQQVCPQAAALLPYFQAIEQSANRKDPLKSSDIPQDADIDANPNFRATLQQANMGSGAFAAANSLLLQKGLQVNGAETAFQNAFSLPQKQATKTKALLKQLTYAKGCFTSENLPKAVKSSLSGLTNSYGDVLATLGRKRMDLLFIQTQINQNDSNNNSLNSLPAGTTLRP